MYQHLSREERYQIFSLTKAQHSISEIARLLGRHRSTISRELRRGRGRRGYRAEQACRKADERSCNSRNARRIDASTWADVAFYLGLQWSPEQIADKLAVSHESVYLHIYANKAAGGELHRNLRSQKPRRKRYLGARDRRGQIANRRPISERPSHIDARKQVGHWEGDTVIGAAHKQAIVTLVERKSGYAVLAKVRRKTADLVGRAIEEKLEPLCARVKTLTVDNGKEFADHQTVDQTLGIKTYFADPYCSWQRGSNENFNGLLRQYIPKKRRLETVTEEELTMIENRLNHRPRKRLGFKTPYEVFHASLNRVAPRT
ncbi:IS30 family transposase [Brachymonas denitrificans]|jgi:IS30 family transposase|uniref:IS30 family transposase n=1 Tax=Brachymonas denitrificans TaxID=28220 RepID=UPI002AFFF202|nr:IS30 family transposase [Brachymonas denitrificans]